MPPLTPIPPSGPQTLDTLLQIAQEGADYALRHQGRIIPSLLLRHDSGLLLYMPETMADEAEKADYVENCRLICAAHGATECVLTLEAWMKVDPDGAWEKTGEKPSEAFDRQEIVCLVGQSGQLKKHKTLAIIRSDNGRFFGLNELNQPGYMIVSGRFTDILPHRQPDEEERKLCEQVLSAKGLQLTTIRPAPVHVRP
jgi:hypothetical protein